MRRLFRYLLFVTVFMVIFSQVAIGSSLGNARLPNDPFFQEPPQVISPITTNFEAYQWALGAHLHGSPADINVIPAWEYVTGHAYLGAADIGLAATNCGAGGDELCPVHEVIAANFREHLSPSFGDDLEAKEGSRDSGHGMHVTGIMAGVTNEGVGVAGICQECSVIFNHINMGKLFLGGQVEELVKSGVQAINMSWGENQGTDTFNLEGVIVGVATQRDVVLVASAGNDRNMNAANGMDYPANHANVIGVGGSAYDGLRWDDSGSCAMSGGQEFECGSNHDATMSVIAPAKQIVSGWYPNHNHDNFLCGDGLHAPSTSPNSVIQGPVHPDAAADDGYGLCTGTSMSAPMVTGIVGLVRSVNPLLSRVDVQDIIETTAENPTGATDVGHGLLNAQTAVETALGSVNDVVLRNRLTPLFALYSNAAEDHFYTTVPQMAMSAINDDPRRIYSNPVSVTVPAASAPYIGPANLSTVPGYPAFPDNSNTPRASVYIFTTDFNPISEDYTLVPLYRTSYISPTATNLSNRDHTYTTQPAGITNFEAVGYSYDGIEGYIFPNTLPQPPGTVRLYRLYHFARDDYAIFPESELAQMQAAGYVSQPGLSDWIGWVYPNVDTDGDHVIDGFEALLGTNPNLSDTDGDGLSDGQEVLDYPYTDPLTAPTANFSGTPTAGTVPLTVAFTDASAGNVTSYLWNFGDGNTSTVQHPSHTYTAVGNYTVSLTVTGPGGTDSHTRTNYITVTEPPPTANFSGTPTAGDRPLTVAFTDASTGSITSYLWNFGDGNTSTAQHPSHTYTTAGSYTVSLTVTGPGGTDSHTRTNYITVTEPPPAANFSGTPTAGDRPLTVAFTNTSTGAITSYLWNFGDGNTSTAQHPSHTYTAVGVYTVTLSVTGPGGADSLTRAGYITVVEPPPAADFSGAPLEGTFPFTVTFTNASTGMITGYQWDFGDGITSTLQHPDHYYTSPGLYDVTLTVTGPGGTDSLTRANYITVNGDLPDATFFGSPQIGNAPLTVQFTHPSDEDFVSWFWDFGDGGFSSVRNPAHTYMQVGVYTVTLTVSDGAQFNSLTRPSYITVTENALIADFTAAPLVGTAPLTVTFTDLSSGAITSRLWDFGDGTSSTLTNPTHVYTTAGVFTATLTITDANGSDAHTDVITVESPLPNANFTGTPRAGEAPLTINFTHLGDGDIVSWFWTFGDGITSTLPHPTHTYTLVGVYTVTLTVDNGAGASTLAQPHYITVTEPAPVANFVGTPLAGTAPLTVTFTNLSTGMITTYLWDFGDGHSSSLPDPTHVYTAVGVYNVSLTVTGPGGTDTRTEDEYITVEAPVVASNLLYLSSDTDGTVATVSFADEDILVYDLDNDTWALYFDGSDVGLGTVDVDAFALLADGSILISLDEPLDLNNNGRDVDDSDILRFVPTSLGNDTDGTFELYFSGAPVGLSTNDEDIDALAVAANGDLLISTMGAVNTGSISGNDEDLLRFTPTELGTNTSGTWAFYFDGSDVGLADSANEDVSGAWLDAQTQKMYLTTLGSFTVNGSSGDGADIFVCDPISTGNNTQCTFGPGLFWDGSMHGLAGHSLDGLAIDFASTAPTANFEVTPTEGVVPLTVNFTDLSDGDITAYLWDFGDGITSTLQHPTHTYTVSGHFTVTLTVSGPAGSDTHIRTNVISVVEPEVSDRLFISSDTGGTVAGLSFADEDILAYDVGSDTWTLYFDGSDVGLGPIDVDAFALLADGSILISLDEPFDLNNNGRNIDDSDILRFVPTSLGSDTDGTFELYFSGASVGLNSSNEDIDALAVTANGDLLISTSGNVNTGTVSGNDEDLLRFTPTELGSNTSGTWTFYFDGSDVGLANSGTEDLTGAWFDAQTQKLYLTTLGAFAVAGSSGDGADIFVCDPITIGDNTDCIFGPGLFWDGSMHGLAGHSLDGLALIVH